MSEYNAYHLNPDNYSFLNIFKEKWPKIKEEYQSFSQANSDSFKLINQLMTPQSQTIKAKQAGTYKAFGFLYNGKSFLQLIQDHHLSWPNIAQSKITALLTQINHEFFKTTVKCLQTSNAAYDNIIRTMYFSVFEPGLDIKPHINYNPHTYRAYLGLFVPQGDLAMKIGGEKLYWHEGEIMILDHTYPHCPHNHTSQTRVALIIDFLKPEKNRQEMLDFEQQLLRKRMQENPYGYGVFGDDDFIRPEDLKKYGFDQQTEWAANLF